MVDKPDDGPEAEDKAFEVTETGETTSPDFLKSNKDRPAEPEWNPKNSENAPCPSAHSMVEVSLDGDAPAETTKSAEPTPSATDNQEKNHPVDLKPDTPSTIHAGEKQLSLKPLLTPPAVPPRESATAPEIKSNIPPKPEFNKIPSTQTVPSSQELRHAAAPPVLDSVPKTTIEKSPTEIPGRAGWAISDGKTLHFPGGAQFTTGDIIECNGRRFRVRVKTGYPPVFYAKVVGLLALVILAAIGISSFFGGPMTGSITGVVLDSNTGRVIENATITLSDGATMTTSAAGLFMAENLPPGDYIIAASASGHLSQTLKVERTERENISLAIALEPIFASTQNEKEKQPEPEKPKKDEPEIEYGTLKLETNFHDYVIYLDGKIYGKDIKTIKKIEPGTHQLTLEKSQYQEYRTEAEIEPRRTTTVRIALNRLKPETTPRQRAKTRFAEGRKALDNDRYQAAIEAFNAALAEVSDYPEALQYRGWALRKLGNAKKASRDFQAAAELYALANRYLDAVTCANLLLEMHPNNGSYYLMRGDFQTALGELNSAIDDYQRAVDISGDSLRFRLALAEGYYRDKQFKEAARLFEKARKMTDNPTDIYVRLILSYMYAGKDKDLVKRYYELADIASPEKMEKLRRDPEWQSVLQLVGPDEKLR